MIYFIQATDGGPIKIGTTVCLSQRLRALSKEFGKELRVLAVTQGSYKQEKALHRRFAHLNVVNELFEPGDDLFGFIVQEGTEWDGEDEETKRALVSLKGGKEYAAWFDEVVDFSHLPAAILIEQAIREWAENHGFEEPQPKR